ncbi:hypothetical protein BDR22DRAFT_778606, partial [Usnea florida]
CPNPECNEKKGVEEDGKLICSACGSVIDELSMVTEVTYGLATGGQHVVHGFHVGADQAFAKRGDVVDKTRAASSRELTAQDYEGHNHIVRIGTTLQMSAQIRDHATQIYNLAIGPCGFIQGRRIKSVAAVALYIACRVQTHPNTFMLIDFSDILGLNVFNLGHVYTKFLQFLAFNSNGYIVQPINPEDLILRFAQRLEFGNETMRVANDAVRIVQRMNRDWMTPGRRPAGVCGAALILAARMNNFRRTVREVVFVVKVQEQTIFNRLDEFKATESGALTIEEFRTIDLERAADPPAFTKDKDGKKKRGRKRKQIDANFGDDGDGIEPTVISSRATSTCPSEVNDQLNTPADTQSQAQLDSQSMPPPPLPQDLSAKPRLPIPDTETISDSEFADDPEVSNCLLTPSEIAIKTRIWTHENREYLRAQSAKILKQQLAEENGTARVIVPRRRRRKRIGDMTAYIGEDGEEGTPVASSPGEAVMKMMKKRGFSRKINY